MTTPQILTAHRSLIVTELEAALRGDSLLYPALRYHVGLEDETGKKAENLGKLLRPSLLLFTAEELGADMQRALPAAVAIELIHNFSLIHDDIQDRDRLRRGRPTVWSRYGVGQGINAGDLMNAIAVRNALEASPRVAEVLVAATIEMIEGQALDIAYESREVTVEQYLEMVDKKTGALIRCAFELGGIIADAAPGTLANLRILGEALGRAFQIRDDILGIWGDDAVTGKPHGSDIRRRKKSLPVVIGLSRARGPDRDLLTTTYGKPDPTDADVAAVIKLLERLEVRKIGEGMADEYLRRARDEIVKLPFSDHGRRQMVELINYLARREK